MRPFRLTIEQALFILAVTLAALLRFIPLNHSALNEAEAALALQSYDLARGSSVALLPHPLYIFSTAFLTFLFGPSSFTARLMPALAGVVLVGLPYLLRRQLGRRTALILAFLIAFDPGWTASSVQAGSSMLAVACLLFALAGWLVGRETLAGIFAGLALLCGPAIWPGVIGFAAAWLISHSLFGLKEDVDRPAFRWQTAGLAAAAVIVLAGTLLLIVPSGLSAAAASLPAYFAGFNLAGAGGKTPVLLMIGALLAYEFLALVLGVSGGVIGGMIERSRLDRFLLVWAGFAALLALVYPSRQVMDLAWVAAPLLGLAARQVNRMLVVEPAQRRTSLMQAGMVLLLLFLISNLVISWPMYAPEDGSQSYRWIVLALALMLLVIEGFLVAWGWSVKIALTGLAWGVSALLALFTIATVFNASGLSVRANAELWSSGPSFSGASFFLKTVRDFAQWTPKLDKTSQIVASGLDSPAVRWSLLDYPGFSQVPLLTMEAQPDMLVTQIGIEPTQLAAYTGQDFILAQSPVWENLTAPDWINWLVYRRVPPGAWNSQKIILWVRTDHFPGSVDQGAQP